jgi:hypothetical protein
MLATAGRHPSADIHAEATAMQLTTGAWQRDLTGMHQRRPQAAHRLALGVT